MFKSVLGAVGGVGVTEVKFEFCLALVGWWDETLGFSGYGVSIGVRRVSIA